MQNIDEQSHYNKQLDPQRSCYRGVVVGLAYCNETNELYWLEHPFLQVLPHQVGCLEHGKTRSNKLVV